MRKLTFEDIEKNGLLLYRYTRGSHCQGTATESSDIDEGGVYICPPEQLLGLGLEYQDQVANSTNDIVWYEFNKYVKLLLSSNPTVLESLFVDDEFVIYEHPIMTELKKHKNEFITKQCFKSFIGYSVEQIKKARGLNKKIVQPIVQRKDILDFCYTFYNQGSSKIENWLSYRGLEQKYCGLVNVPNMYEMYSVFYDFGAHFKDHNITKEKVFDILNEYGYLDIPDEAQIVKNLKLAKEENNESLIKKNEKLLGDVKLLNMLHLISDTYKLNIGYFCSSFFDWFDSLKPIGYRGIVSSEKVSQDVRLSSIAKDEPPICFMSYNKDGYVRHCKDYKEYKDWVKNRNPERFRLNTSHGKNYDSKNMAHCVRLLHNGIEIAKTGEYKVNRAGIDRDFILQIKRGEMDYDELIEYVEKKKLEMEEAMATSSIPDSINIDKVNEFLINIRLNQLKNNG